MSEGEIPSLPQEIMEDILSRLPAKYIAQFRCVSNPWRTLLSDPQFINTHLINRHTKENLILISPNQSLYTITNLAVSRKLSFQPELSDTWTEVVGSCNGLVLLVNEEEDKFLVNPTTLKQVKIRDSPLALNKRKSSWMHGFGYDVSSDDYKIVTLSYYDPEDVNQPDTFVDVYSVKRGVWRRLEPSPYSHTFPDLSPGAFVNGSIHWLATTSKSSYTSVIAAFDLVDEKFKEIPAPGCLDETVFVFNKLVTFGGRLCLIDDTQDNVRFDVWIMEEYGVKNSWVKFSVVLNSDWERVKLLCFIGDDEVLLYIDEERLVVYNLKGGTSRDLIVDGVPALFIEGGAYMESLVSTGFGDCIGVQHFGWKWRMMKM
ncbi:F-box/kelch-repeat protein [Forsythia ovata]|uniref:F-box/kelch-repeat protein n=1 Tax=Forsythia ovata TaxID=205694 RepID=A0ABD1P5U8_9LAMI